MFDKRSLFNLLTLVFVLSALLAASACSGTPPIDYTPVPTKPLPTDEAAPISEEPIPSSLPVFGGKTPIPLPEGPLTIVYTKLGNLWVWTLDDEPRQVTFGGNVFDVRLSDDSQMVAFLLQLDTQRFELWVVDVDGTGERRLVSADEFEQSNPNAEQSAPNRLEWVPGTHTLAYNTRIISDTPGTRMGGDLHLVDADSGEKQVIFEAGSVGDFYYAPDGSLIAFASPDAISVAYPDGSQLTQLLTYTVEGTLPEFPYYPVPKWDQDSSRIGIALPVSDPMSSALQEVTFWLIPLDGSEPVKQGSIQTIEAGNWLYLSPDLEHVLYMTTSTTPGSNHREIHVSRLDGSESQTAGGEDFLMAFGWMDEQTILYGGGETTDVYAWHIDGESAELAQGVGGLFDARPVSDGNVLLFQGDGSSWNLSLYADGATFPVDSGAGFSTALDADW